MSRFYPLRAVTQTLCIDDILLCDHPMGKYVEKILVTGKSLKSSKAQKKSQKSQKNLIRFKSLSTFFVLFSPSEIPL